MALPPVPFCSDTQGAHVHPWDHMAEHRTPEVSRVFAYQGGWAGPASPSLSRSSPGGAELHMAGLDREAWGSGLWKGLLVADRVLPPACRWGAP